MFLLPSFSTLPRNVFCLKLTIRLKSFTVSLWVGGRLTILEVFIFFFELRNGILASRHTDLSPEDLAQSVRGAVERLVQLNRALEVKELAHDDTSLRLAQVSNLLSLSIRSLLIALHFSWF